MDELIARMQAKIEIVLEHYLPQHTSPYFDRQQLVSRLMLIAHSHGLEVSEKLVGNYLCTERSATKVLETLLTKAIEGDAPTCVGADKVERS